jgi:simple sugar transport system permease protein
MPENWLLAPAQILSPRIGALTWLDLFALAVPVAAFGFLFRTSWGLRLRAGGESIADASALKIPFLRYRLSATLAGGALSGLAGAALALELSDSFVEGMSAGRGFLALALVAFGRWNPLAVAGAAILFGLLQAAQYQLQAAGVFHLPSQALLLLPYVFSLIALAGFSGKRLAPADLGKPG